MANIFVLGHPIPKARPRMSKKGKKVNVYTPARTKQWEEKIGWQWKTDIPGDPVAGPVVVTIRVYHCQGKRGDLDNYVKAVLDGLNGVAFVDDKQIEQIDAAFGHTFGGECREGVDIRVQELD